MRNTQKGVDVGAGTAAAAAQPATRDSAQDADAGRTHADSPGTHAANAVGRGTDGVLEATGAAANAGTSSSDSTGIPSPESAGTAADAGTPAQGSRGSAAQADPRDASAQTDRTAAEAAGNRGVADAPQELMQAHMNLNPQVQHYGNGKADIYDFGILDQNGHLTNVVLKGEQFSIRERIRFLDTVEAPIFTFTIKDKRGQDLTGTNTMFEGRDIPAVRAGDSYDCTFTQRMTLQGGEYLLSMSCTGFEQGVHTVYDRKYDIANITVLSNKNTVGVYDMESAVTLERYEKA